MFIELCLTHCKRNCVKNMQHKKKTRKFLKCTPPRSTIFCVHVFYYLFLFFYEVGLIENMISYALFPNNVL